MSSPKRRWTYILPTLLIGALCVSFGPAYDAFRIGSAYSAKIAASAMFVGGRTLEQVREQELSFLPFVSLDVDKEGQSVTGSIVGLADETAIYNPDFGATLAHGSAPAIREKRAGADPRAALAPEPVMFSLNSTVPGVDYAGLNESITWATTATNAAPPINTRAVAVFYDGQLVGEGYAEGFDRTTRFAGFSMTKSVTSALIGILVKQGHLQVDAQAPISAWQSEGDPRSAITLNHMLRMTTGLAFEEQYFNPFADAVRMLFGVPDAPAYAMKKPLQHAPGERWYYSSGTTNMLQWVIRRQFETDEEYWRFPYDALFAPLGMHSAVIEPDANGTYVGSSFMWATAHDWARLGLLYLNDGVWEGQRLLPEGWVEYSITPAPAAPQGEYGAQWWLNAGEPGNPENRPMPELPTDVYYASGFEGQKVYVVPSRKAVLVRLGCTQGPGWRNPGFAARLLEALPEG